MKDQVIRISIALLDVDPAIWRRIEVPANYTLEGLHDVIQIVMGWADYHLHHFQFGDVMYGVPSPEDRGMHDGHKIKLSTALVWRARLPISLRLWRRLVLRRGARSHRPDGPGRRLSASRRRRQAWPAGGCRRSVGLWRVPGGHRRPKARAPRRTARMVRRRLRPAAVQRRRNQSPHRLARTPKEYPPQDHQAGHRLNWPMVLTGRIR